MRIRILTKSGARFPIILIFISLFCAFFFSISPAMPKARAFHTYHTSLTRIDYDEKEKLAEITIQMFPHDLVPLLEKRTKKNVELEKSKDADEAIFKYLTENFVLKNKQDEIQKIVWVGKEIRADMIFVYVEIPMNTDFDEFQLQNTLFFESFPEQTNLVIARSGEKKSDLFYKAGDKFKEIKFSDSTEKK